LKNEFEKKLSDLWNSNYCKPEKGGSLAARGDQVFRCLKNYPTDPPQFVQQWYQENLGLTVEQVSEIVQF